MMSHPLKERLAEYQLILASASPRRKELLAALDLDFEVRTMGIDEHYPKNLTGKEITEYLAEIKARAFKNLTSKEIVLTSDTIVWKEGKALMKPRNKKEAKAMLQELSSSKHEVITSVCIYTKQGYRVFSDYTLVYFNSLTDSEIDYYIDKYKPFDKAGGYGIQEWIGYIGIEKIEGSYYNVMGLPVEKLYRELCQFISK